MLQLMVSRSPCEADQAFFCGKPLNGGGPVTFVGSAQVEGFFEFGANIGGGFEKSISNAATFGALGRRLYPFEFPAEGFGEFETFSAMFVLVDLFKSDVSDAFEVVGGSDVGVVVVGRPRFGLAPSSAPARR